MSSNLDPQLYSDEDFRFRLGTIPGNVEDFFAPSPESDSILAERRSWLASDPARYRAILPAGVGIAAEFLNIASSWSALNEFAPKLQGSPQPLLERFHILGGLLEPDTVLLAPRSDGQFTVEAGCVCFPSSWRLTDKLGLTVSEVHGPVPNLNAALEVPIDRLLAHLRPGKCVIRANWSVCQQPELNQHLDRNLPGLSNPVGPDQAWLRREDQCLYVMPKTGGIVFGIRVTHLPWRSLQQIPAAARSVARTLCTMPQEMLNYKRLTSAWEELARLLTDPQK